MAIYHDNLLITTLFLHSEGAQTIKISIFSIPESMIFAPWHQDGRNAPPSCSQDAKMAAKLVPRQQLSTPHASCSMHHASCSMHQDVKISRFLRARGHLLYYPAIRHPGGTPKTDHFATQIPRWPSNAITQYLHYQTSVFMVPTVPKCRYIRCQNR